MDNFSIIATKKTIKDKKMIKRNLEKIRSNCILSKIFSYIKKQKILQIIKYNKKIQKRLDVNIKDFNEISQIEIIAVPYENKFGNFINIFNKKFEEYYHIYFNDSKEEIKRNYLIENEKVKKIKIVIDYQVESLSGIFFNCDCIESINFIRSKGNNINNINCMFALCRSLKKINFSSFKGKNLNDMSYMFWECSQLEELYISNFDTNINIKMDNIFFNCSNLKVLCISNFNNNS